MKSRMIAVVLFFAAVSLAQTSSQPAPNPSQPQNPTADAKSKCPCCEKMSGAKDSEMCCAHHNDASSDSAMPRCQSKDGKDAMSCAKGDAGCGGDKCGAKGQKGCCDQSTKQTGAQGSCCAANHEHGDMAHGHCGMMDHHDRDPMTE